MPPDTIEDIKLRVKQLEATLVKDLSRESEIKKELHSVIDILGASQQKLDGGR